MTTIYSVYDQIAGLLAQLEPEKMAFLMGLRSLNLMNTIGTTSHTTKAILRCYMLPCAQIRVSQGA